MIVFDASTLVSAALKVNSIPERALLRAEEVDVFALSSAVDAEFAEVLSRPKFARAISLARRGHYQMDGRLKARLPRISSTALRGKTT